MKKLLALLFLVSASALGQDAEISQTKTASEKNPPDVTTNFFSYSTSQAAATIAHAPCSASGPPVNPWTVPDTTCLIAWHVPFEICRLVTATTVGPSSSTESGNLIGTCTIPASTLTTTSGKIHVIMHGSMLGNAAANNGFNPRIKLNGTTVYSDSNGSATLNATPHRWLMEWWMGNTGVANTQIGYGTFWLSAIDSASVPATGGGSIATNMSRTGSFAFTGAVTTSSAITLTFTISNNANDPNMSTTLSYVSVELWP